MSVYELIGALGTLCYFARFLVQWIRSEKAGRSVAPVSFWWLSLVGSLLLSVYCAHRSEPVLLAGYLINGTIYVRNLWLYREGARTRRLGVVEATAVGVLVALFLISVGAVQGLFGHAGEGASGPAWLACVLVGQAFWSSRFVLQWWYSERRGESHFPLSFWWASLGGNLLLLVYALHLADAVFIAGYSLGPFVQIRNLLLETRKHRSSHEAASRHVAPPKLDP